MIVSSTGYSLVSLVGKNIVDYYEEPLAIKTFEGDDIYNAINASAQITLMSYPANYLYIISETDMVSAELLSKKIQNGGSVDFFENNSFKKHEVMPVSLEVLPDNVLKISLQAVGCAVADVSNYPVRFDFVKGAAKDASKDAPVTVMFGGQTYEIIPSQATTVAGILCAVSAAIVFGLGLVVLPNIESSKTEQVNELNTKIQTIDEQLKNAEGEKSASGAFDMAKQVDYVLKSNRAKLMNYSSLGTTIPDTVWITYFMTSDDGLVDVKGQATNVEDIYVFFKNMKDSLINTKLRLHKLQMRTGSVDDLISDDDNASYEFEITNMEDSQLNVLLGLNSDGTPANAGNNASGGGANNQNNNNQNNNNAAPNNKLLSDAPVQVN